MSRMPTTSISPSRPSADWVAEGGSGGPGRLGGDRLLDRIESESREGARVFGDRKDRASKALTMDCTTNITK
jgi:hypothetical protein